jgi:hypothetical protein
MGFSAFLILGKEGPPAEKKRQSGLTSFPFSRNLKKNYW